MVSPEEGNGKSYPLSCYEQLEKLPYDCHSHSIGYNRNERRDVDDVAVVGQSRNKVFKRSNEWCAEQEDPVGKVAEGEAEEEEQKACEE